MEVAKKDRSELEETLMARISSLEERVQQSARENDLLHEESARV